MDVAALIISALALLLAGASAYYTRREANAAKEALEHQYGVWFVLESLGTGGGHRWVLKNQGNGLAESVRVVWDFDKSGREYGRLLLGDFEGRQSVPLSSTKPLPEWHDLLVRGKSGYEQEGATVFYTDPRTGKEVSVRPRLTVGKD